VERKTLKSKKKMGKMSGKVPELGEKKTCPLFVRLEEWELLSLFTTIQGRPTLLSRKESPLNNNKYMRGGGKKAFRAMYEGICQGEKGEKKGSRL